MKPTPEQIESAKKAWEIFMGEPFYYSKDDEEDLANMAQFLAHREALAKAAGLEEAAHYHDDFASHLLTDLPGHEASERYRRIHLRDAGIFQARAAALRSSAATTTTEGK